MDADESRIGAGMHVGGVQTSRRVGCVRTNGYTRIHIRIHGCARERAPLTHPLIRPFALMLMIIHATDLLYAARASPSDAAMRRLGKRQEAERKRARKRKREGDREGENAAREK